MSKKTVIKHFGRIVQGNLSVYNSQFWKSELAALEGKEFELIIKEKSKRISYSTHAYYRGGVLETALQFEIFGGWTKEELHLFLCSKFLNKEISKKNAVFTITQSTSELNQKEMNEFVEKVIQWLAEQGIVILTPEQYYYEHYREIKNGETSVSQSL